MLHIKIIRTTPKKFQQPYTHGHMLIKENNESRYKDFCYTLEDAVRDYNKDGDLLDYKEEKVYGETAIPFGSYEGQITYSPAFEQRLPLIKNVPHFTGIRIHAGNTKADTKGCPLVGLETNHLGAVWKSRSALSLLLLKIKSNDPKERFKIEIV